MNTAHSVMHPDVVSICVRDTLDIAAQQMRQRDIGALVICDGERHPVGVVTDRDIVVNCLALGRNPATATAGEFAQGDELCAVDASTELAEVVALMQRYQIRRLPVTESGRLTGIITEADLVRSLPGDTVGALIGSVCEHKLPMPT